ncbi:MAG TPA: GAF domain-containing protein, partial [Bdellovibrionota bacterium]|nr:GAF domain-containing protein [Bdellovibrionota bacterium]
RLAVEEVERLNRAEERLRILSEAGMLLTSTLDYGDVLSQVISLTTRHFDAWAKLRLLNGDGTIQVVTGHSDPALEAKFRILEEKYPPTEDLKEGPLWVLRNGGRQFFPVLTDEGNRAFAKNEEHYELLRHFKSYICVPIKSHDRVFGTLSMLGTARHYSEEDLAFAEDLSRWVALAIENARHFAQREAAQPEVTRLPVEPRRPNPTAEIWLDSSGLVRVKIMPKKIQTVEIARQNFETAVDVRGGVRRPLLTDIRDAEPLDAAVRSVYAGPAVGECFSAMAILIRQSSLGSMMGNLYFRVAKPGIDMRLFDNESKALDWLKTYL